MKTVHKFPLRLADTQEVLMPAGATVLHVGHDPSGGLCLWALVATNELPALHTFHVTGTGHPVPEGLVIHRGSAVQGPFVWHVWEKF